MNHKIKEKMTATGYPCGYKDYPDPMVDIESMIDEYSRSLKEIKVWALKNSIKNTKKTIENKKKEENTEKLVAWLESKVEDYYEEMKKYDPEFVEAELKETVLVTDFE
jgi:hypothetical protein